MVVVGLEMWNLLIIWILILIIVIILVYCIIGVIGNVIVFVIYWKKMIFGKGWFFILILVFVDFFVSFVLFVCIFICFCLNVIFFLDIFLFYNLLDFKCIYFYSVCNCF